MIAARTHDLLRLRAVSALVVDAPLPEWAEIALRDAPWVVVRRGPARPGLIPVGVRGADRAQRLAAFAPASAVDKRCSPEDVLARAGAVSPKRRNAVPAIAAVASVAPILAQHSHRWGPGGSVGFEIATKVPTTTAASDLDIVLRGDRRLNRDDALELLSSLTQAASPARVDVLLETPRGGVSLADLAKAGTLMLLRTADGPLLCADPWS